MNLLRRYFGKKLFEMGEHRVEPIYVKQVRGPRRTKYRCVDCFKREDTREDFRDEECYDYGYYFR